MAPTTLTRARLRTVLATALCTATLTAVTPALAQATPDTAETAAALVTDVTRTQSEMDRLTLEISALHEEVNKALVDLHDAQGTAEQARQAVIIARAQLDETQQQIEEAQARLDEISRAAYRRTTTPPAVATLAGEEASTDSLDRQTYLRTNAEKQRTAIEELDQLRTEQANRESELRKLRNIAEAREARAQGREAEVREAIRTNDSRISELAVEHQRLTAERDAAQAQLEAARTEIATGNAQRQDAQEYREADAARRAAEDAEDSATADAQAAEQARHRAAEEAAAAEAAREAAAEEARRAEEAEARARAEADARERREAEEAARVAREAAERAEAEAAARREAQERAAAEAAETAAREAEAAAFRDAATAAAVAAAAAVVAASQPEHTELDNPYPSVTDEESAPAPIAAVQNPQPLVEEELSTGPVLDTIEDVTEQAAEQVSAIGDRAAQIEAVIARAESQIGVPYAWGGGNASGPTQGIRDGGVADSFGDYNKIGFDCSGLVLYAFAGAGIALPHYTGYQYNHGTQIDPSQMERGDLIFYGPGGSHHVAIYAGDGMMIEAPNSGASVQKVPVRWSGMSPYAVRLI